MGAPSFVQTFPVAARVLDKPVTASYVPEVRFRTSGVRPPGSFARCCSSLGPFRRARPGCPATHLSNHAIFVFWGPGAGEPVRGRALVDARGRVVLGFQDPAGVEVHSIWVSGKEFQPVGFPAIFVGLDEECPVIVGSLFLIPFVARVPAPAGAMGEAAKARVVIPSTAGVGVRTRGTGVAPDVAGTLKQLLQGSSPSLFIRLLPIHVFAEERRCLGKG